MSLYGSLYSGVSGLKSQSNRIGIISDNISNTNTIGYKGGSGVFESLVTNSGTVAYSPGGVLGQTKQQVSRQGLLQTTDSATDIAISGKGFFVVSSGAETGSGEVLYTRAGAFTQDSLGNFRNSAGFYLQAWPLDREGKLPGASGNLNTTSATSLSSLETVNVQSLTGVAAATTKISVSANLQSSQRAFLGQGGTVDMDAKTAYNFGISSKDIIAPGGANSLARNDKFTVTTGTGLSYSYRYGGFTFTRAMDGSSLGDSGTTPISAPLTLGNNPFAMTNGSDVVTVTSNGHGLANGAVVTLSGVAGTVGGVPSSSFNQSFVISNVTTNTFNITLASGVADNNYAATGGAGISVVTRPFVGTVMDASTPTGAFLGVTGISGFTSAALSFSIVTPSLGTQTFTYTAATPNAQLKQFNNLTNLATAINAVDGLSARVVNGKMYVGAVDANEPITFTNGSTIGDSGPPVKSGLDWVGELGLADIVAGDDRFASMEGLAKLVNNSPGLSATVTNPQADSTLSINVNDPLDTITFSDPAVAAPLAPFTSATPFSTASGSTTVTVSTPSPHGLKTGDIITLDPTGFAGYPAGTVNGIPYTDFNGQFSIRVTGPSTYTIITATAATSSGPDGDTGLVMTPPNNSGSVVAELGLVDSLDGAPYSQQTTGELGPAYDAEDSNKNMAAGLIVPQYFTNVRIYDSLGTGHEIRVGFIKVASNTWAAEIYAVPKTDVSDNYPDGQLGFGTITFNGDGSLRTVSSGLISAFDVNWTNGAAESAISLNWGTAGLPYGTVGATQIGKTDGVSQFDANYKLNFVTQNGVPVGELTGVTITEAGIVVANYNNGETQQLYKIPIADFANPDQMQTVSGNVFNRTNNSGEVNLREAGTNGTGNIQSSTLESSNVELAEQLTDMIVAQRAYQASTKVITTADSLLEELNRILT